MSKKFLRGIVDFFVSLESRHCRNRFYFAVFMLIGVWLMSRLPFFLYYPVPSIEPDYSSYHDVVWQMEQGKLPVFGYRTPGYPLFMAAILIFSKKLMSVVFIQHILTLLTSVLAVFAVGKAFPRVVLLAAVALAVFFSSGTQVQVDSSLLTESLFTNVIIASFAFLLLAQKTGRLLHFGLASAAMAFSIYVRPTGQFFIVIFVMVLGYMLLNKMSRRTIVAFSAPFLAVMLFLPTYNFLTYGTFNITNGKEVTLICGASFFLLEDEHYSPELNQIISKVRGRFSAEDRQIVESTWDPIQFYSHYYKNEYWDISKILSPFKDAPEAKEQGVLKIYKMVAENSIRKNLPIFLKLYVLNLYHYFFVNIRIDYNFYDSTLPISYNLLFKQRDYGRVYAEVPRRQSLLREFFEPAPLPNFVETSEDTYNGTSIKVVPTFMERVHQSYLRKHYEVFRQVFWPVATIVLCLISLIVLVFGRFQHFGGFFMLLMTASAIGHGMICSIFANTPRFSTPTQFLYYLSVALVPVLFTRSVKPDAPILANPAEKSSI